MSEFHFEDDVMLAALDFIDSFDSDSDPQPTSPAPTPARASLKRPRTTSGQRRRAEIQRLRGVMTELEARLEELRRTSHPHQHHHAVVANTWETIASRQKQQREQAETQNTQLREALTKQTRLVQKLEQLVARGHRLQTTSMITQQLVAVDGDLHY